MSEFDISRDQPRSATETGFAGRTPGSNVPATERCPAIADRRPRCLAVGRRRARRACPGPDLTVGICVPALRVTGQLVTRGP